MLTKEQLGARIAKRASDQFSRDVYRLGTIMAQNYGELSANDMQKLLIDKIIKKKGLLKRVFKKKGESIMSEEANDMYYLMQLAFKIMDIKSVNKITLEDLTPEKLRPIYMKHFKREYEEYELHEYTVRDVLFQERAMAFIAETKNGTIQIEDEMT